MPADENPLSKREQEILGLVARGMTNQEIARELVISPNTVKVHLRNIFAKLEVASRTEATMKGIQSGWIAVEGLDEGESDERVSEAKSAEPPLPAWQRVYFLAAAGLVLAALLLAFLPGRTPSASSLSDLSDAGLTRFGAAVRNDASRWSALAPLPDARSRLALAELDGRLYAIAGEGPDGITGVLQVYDPETNGWLPRASKPTAVSNVQAAVVNGKILVPGGVGVDGAVMSGLEIYDPATDRWDRRADLPVALAGYALATHQDNMYLFGGWDGSSFVDRVFVYDAHADRWTESVGSPHAFGFSAAASLGDRIFVVGGYDGRQELNNCRIFSPGESRWQACAPTVFPRGGLGLASNENYLYAIGGGWETGVDFNERYDSLTDTWSSIPTPFHGQWRSPGVASLESRVYAVGGWSGDYLDANEVFETTFRAFLPFGASGN
ncbi:MAG: LuxR C-terminal-related transcriptional regulator [Chloroflexota bacterium]|nr:LuxR C-terminal-related transcriptional regulator [Chloroflexota bacterium]